MNENPNDAGNAVAPEENLLNLLDGASSQFPVIAAELEDARRMAADPSKPLDQRLEALDDIIDSEVGDTNLTRARNLERQVGLRQIFLKFEGGNPTGTQKDRIAFAHARDAVRRGYEAITVATCGNFGAAVATAAAMSGLRALIYIPEAYHTRRVTEMAELGARIIRVPGDYEASVEASMQRAPGRRGLRRQPGRGPTPPCSWPPTAGSPTRSTTSCATRP